MWRRTYPPPSTFKCHRCSSCMWQEKSFERHVRAHYPTPPAELWVCTVCNETSPSRQSIAQHHRNRTMQTPAPGANPIQDNSTSPPQDIPATQCCYCDALLPTVKGLRNHERAHHQAQVSADLTRQPATTNKNPPWSKQEKTSFLAAVRRFGLKHNTLISQAIGSRTATQVANFKARYAKSHPLWAIQSALPTTTPTMEQGTQSSPSGSPSSNSSKSLQSSPPQSLPPCDRDQSPGSSPSQRDSKTPTPEHPDKARYLSLRAQTSLQMANKALAALRDKPASPLTSASLRARGEPTSLSAEPQQPTPPHQHPAGSPPRAPAPSPPSQPTPPDDLTSGRQGSDPVERDYRNGNTLQHHQDTLPQSINNLVASIRQEVEAAATFHPLPGTSHRKRRQQGRLSSPSTVGEAIPPPPLPSQRDTSPFQLNRSPSPTPSQHTTPTRPHSISPLHHTPPRSQPPNSPAPTRQPGVPPTLPQLVAPTRRPCGPPPSLSQAQPRTATSAGKGRGWSLGPYEWYGVNWLAKHVPYLGFNRASGEGMQGNRGRGAKSPQGPNRGEGVGPRGTSKGRGQGMQGSSGNRDQDSQESSREGSQGTQLGAWEEWGAGPWGKAPRNIKGRGGASANSGGPSFSTERAHNGDGVCTHAGELSGGGGRRDAGDLRRSNRGPNRGRGASPRGIGGGRGGRRTQGPNGGRYWDTQGDGGAGGRGDLGAHGIGEGGHQPADGGVGSGVGFSFTGPLLMNAEDDHAPRTLFKRLQPYLDRRLSDEDWTQWCSLIEHWTQGFSKWFHERSNRAQQSPQSAWARRQQDKRLNGRQPNPHHTSNLTRNRTITRMVALQKAYRQDPKRCMGMIRQSPPPIRCLAPIATVHDFFKAKQVSTSHTVTPGPPPVQLWQDVSQTDLLGSPITSEEVRGTLMRTNANSAPGPDNLSYSAWKKLDPKYSIITAILNICRVNEKVPPSWKRSATILIHKGDDVNNLDNWRPIALQNTLYKVYASIIARRLSSWAIDNKILSPSQKGFLPYEGCLEHGFALKSILQDSRRRKREVSVAWLDLKDAFGSVPHPVLLESLRLAGLRGTTLAAIQDIYTNSFTSVKTSSETSPPPPPSSAREV